MPPPLDDAELLAAIQNGDADAAEALYIRLQPRIDATVRRLLGAGDVDHEDCVQSALLEVVRSIDSYRGECPIEHWASRVAAHVVYKHIRRRRFERGLFERPAAESQVAEPVSSTRRLVVKDLIGRVRAKVGTLHADKAFTFLLHDVMGLDLREIAEATGVSVAAAQKRLVRGRRELHAALARDPELANTLHDVKDDA